MAETPSVLSLADLEAHDPHARSGGRERRFLCPLCGGSKKADCAHRSLSLQADTGLWKCHRCGEGGILSEHQTRHAPQRSLPPHRERARRALQSVTFLPATTAAPLAAAFGRTLTIGAKQYQILPLGGPACGYLEHRGISHVLAHAAGVRFCPNWHGHPAIVFPVYQFPAQGRARCLVAAQGRFIDADGLGQPKTRTSTSAGRTNASQSIPKVISAGPISQGVFATPGAWDASVVVLTEAPLDALSLAACGIPALALCGKDLRPWLLPRLAFRPVLLALDADAAGDAAAEKAAILLSPYGGQIIRLRPRGAKDWNELLTTLGLDALTALVRAQMPTLSELSADDDSRSQDTKSFFEQVCLLFGPVIEISDI
jgi:hypothetical protein